jgi:hypothetical protein
MRGLGQSACGTDPCGVFDEFVWPSQACCAFMNCNGGQTSSGITPLSYVYACGAGAAANVVGNMTPIVYIGIAALAVWLFTRGK